MGLADARRRVRKLRRDIDAERQRREDARKAVKGPGDYPTNPVGYAKEILGIEVIWDVMAEAAEALLVWPHRVMLKAGHKLGKSFFAAWITNWFYDNFNPSQCTTTAPKFESVKDIVWKEIRTQRRRANLGGGLQPKAPEMSDAPDHVAKGTTANSGEGFQGRHGLRQLMIFDEAVGIDPVFWEVARTMVKPEDGHMWLCLLNPTDTTSRAYIEDNSTDRDGNPRWRTFTLDCLDHPNIRAQTAAKPGKPPIPAAVTLPMVNDWLESFGCDPIPADQAGPQDLEWPPRSGQWWRQSPTWLARCRGIWPESSAYSIWSEHLWKVCCERLLTYSTEFLPEIGLDVARYGDDFTSFHVRWGPCSMAHHGRYQGISTVKTANRSKELCHEWAARFNAAEKERYAVAVAAGGKLRAKPPRTITGKMVKLKVDDDGVGGGVVDQLREDGFFVVPVGAATLSRSGKYPNKRSELWFDVADRGRMGLLDMSRLDKGDRSRLKQQAMAAEYSLDAAGRRCAASKDDMKKKLGRSPDDMDSMNLAYYEDGGIEIPPTIEEREQRKVWARDEASGKPRRRIFGG